MPGDGDTAGRPVERSAGRGLPALAPDVVRWLLLVPVLALAPAAGASGFMWDEGSRHAADIDCDGTPDEILIGYAGSAFRLQVVPSSKGMPVTLDFGLGQAEEQAALCGTRVKIRLYETDSDAIEEEFGTVFEGYRSAPGCFEISLEDEQCDSIKRFWNHDKGTLDWWRR